MPIYESTCAEQECELHNIRIEWYASTSDKPDPPCEVCGSRTKRLISRFAALWTGALDRFDDPGREPHNKIEGGHIAYRVRSSRLVNGAPEPVRITTRKQQREYCREEGLMMPDDLNPNARAGDDGKSLSTVGMPGAWV